MLRQRRTANPPPPEGNAHTHEHEYRNKSRSDVDPSRARHGSSSKNDKDHLTATIFSIITAAVCILASALWINNGIVFASHNTWIPVPFIGYCRWDVAVMFLAAEAAFIYLSRTRRLIQSAAVTVLLFGLPYLPDRIRPMFHLGGDPETLMLKHPDMSKGRRVLVHDTGFSQEEAAALVNMTMTYKDRWTHVSRGQALGWFEFGSTIHNNAELKGRQYSGYSIQYGFEPLLGKTLTHESYFRLLDQEDIDSVQSLLQIELAPKLRQVLANTLGIGHDQIVFGNEIEGGSRRTGRRLSMPATAIYFHSLFFHWIQNSHSDKVFQNRVPPNIPCKKADEVTTFVIPLTAPEGSGLRTWTMEENDNLVMNEVFYEVGNVYTWDASHTLHAVRPWPYFEWKRDLYRIGIQGFGVQCDDSKWYIYH